MRHTEAKAKARERETERLQQLCLEQLNQSSPGGIFLISFQLGLHRPSAKPTDYALAAWRTVWRQHGGGRPRCTAYIQYPS